MAITTKEEAMKLTVAKLKDELTARQLSTDGLKAVLLDRLLKDIAAKDEAEAKRVAEEEEAKAKAAEAEAEAEAKAKAEAEAEAEAEAKARAEEEAKAAEAQAKADADSKAKAEQEEAEAGARAAEAEAEAQKREAEVAPVAEPEVTDGANGEAAAENLAAEGSASTEVKDEPTGEAAKMQLDSSVTATDTAEASAHSETPNESEEPKAAGAAATPKKEVKAPSSPASVGGGDEPPPKKAKTANGGTPARKGRITGDPSGREILVNNLPESTTEEELKKLAEEKGGTVGFIRVMQTKDVPSKCRGLALIRFMDRESSKKALEALPDQLIGDPPQKLAARPSSNANTLFIGNLNKTWTKESVLKAFEESVQGVVNFEITMDAMNKTQNRGFGFATFESVEACQAAHAKYHKDKLKIMDNQVLMDWAETRGKEDDERGVYVQGVAEDIEDATFKEHFGKHGKIEKVVYGRLIPHAKRNDFAIINFATREDARVCIEKLNNTQFMGKTLEVSIAKAKRKRDGHGSGYDNRGGRGGYGDNRRNSYGGGRSGSRGGSYGNRNQGSGQGYGGAYGGRGGYNSGPRSYGGGRGYGGGGGGGGYANPYTGGGRGYAPPAAYNAYPTAVAPQPYHAGGQPFAAPAVPAQVPALYQQPPAYGAAYGAQPVAPQPYLAGGSAPQSQQSPQPQWPQPRGY